MYKNMYIYRLNFVGIGLCMMYISNAVILQQVFSVNRALAAGAGMAGLSLGSTVGSPLTEWLVETYGWRGALLIHGAIVAQCLPLAMLYRNATKQQTSRRELKKETTIKSEKIDGKLRDEKTVSACVFLSDMCDFTLLKKLSFSVFCLAHVFLMINATAFWFHVQSRAVFFDIPMSRSSLLPSYLALGLFLSRCVFSFIANLQCSNTLFIYSMGALLGSAASFMLTLTTDYQAMALCSVVFGSHIGQYNKYHNLPSKRSL